MNNMEKLRLLSAKQKHTLIEFVHSRPEIYRGAFLATYTYTMNVTLWKQISDILNSIPGRAKKDWKQWRKEPHYRYSVHNDPSPGPSNKNMSGLIPGPLKPLDPANEKVLALVPEPSSFKENISRSISLGISPRPSQKQKRNENYSPKRMTKSSRLAQSLRNNEKFLTISQNGIVSTETYRQRKLELLRTQVDDERRYREEKLEVLRDISQSFNGIAEALNLVLEKIE